MVLLGRHRAVSEEIVKLTWYPTVRWIGQPATVDQPRWSRMEKLTAASIALGVVGLAWTVYQRAK